MEIAENVATMLNEKMETAMLAEHAQWTNFDNASIGGAAGNITVAVTNIKSIITGIKREIREAGGGEMMNRNGLSLSGVKLTLNLLNNLLHQKVSTQQMML